MSRLAGRALPKWGLLQCGLLVLALLSAGAGTRPAGAQVRRLPGTRDTIPTRSSRDSAAARTPADTGRGSADTVRTPRGPGGAPGDTVPAAFAWVTEDSVARALMARPGYTVTRYQAPILTFDALTRAIHIVIGSDTGNKVAVQREGRLIVADTSITYDEASGIALATGRVLVRENDRDLTGLGGRYDLKERSVTIRGGRTIVESDERWLVTADLLKAVQADSGAGQNFFGRSGTLTSCTDTTHAGVPHYHFAFQEIKRTAGNTLVARPAVLYIADIPVLWLPFVFQDMRPGRRSGLLTPRIGLTDFIRNSPSYQRRAENIGYYWAISDYMDAELALDWLSGTGRGPQEAPGFVRLNGEWRYKWIDRFLSGSLAANRTSRSNASDDVAISWLHRQEFTRDRSIQADVNWRQNTSVQRETYVDPRTVLATISSRVNLQDRLGPARIALGADRTQYPGRDEVNETFPKLSVTTGTIALGPNVSWTPSFELTQLRRKDITQPSQLGVLFRETPEGLVTDSVRQNSRTTSATFGTPLQLFGYTLANAFSFNEEEVNFPQVVTVVSRDTTQPAEDRVFARTYRSQLNWNPSFSLPALAQGTWNVTPSLGFANVAPGPFMVRSQLSNGRWVRQNKRPTVGVSIAPTFYGLFPGFWGFSRFRHSIGTRLSYQYAPPAGVSDEFLLAQNISPRDYIGAISQNQVSLGFDTNIEAKGQPAAGDSSRTSESAPKVNVVSVSFTPLSYDISRYQKTHRLIRGLTTETFNTSMRSDLLPGVALALDYSLFQGSNVASDTAVFSPYLTRVSGSFQLNARRNPFMLLNRIFGRAIPADQIASAEIVEPIDDAEARAASSQAVAGSRARQSRFVVPPAEGWDAAFTFSSSRQRPPRGGNVVEFDPTARCEPVRVYPFAYEQCVADARLNPPTDAPVTSPQSGGAFYRVPPSTSIGSRIRFTLSSHWSGSWDTSYDVERNEFASHVIQMQRDLHDWRAIFSFTQSPSGSFSFSFFIALKAEPDLKVDYNRATYRQEARR